ncbi:MAG: TonB-dependent receptor [Bacteroidales bacterium]|nr:TonB-dependent receptor [Bacteroidales bacterium]
MGFRRNANENNLHSIRIDSLLKTKYFACDLAQVLKSETNLNITQYGGQGSLTSLRMRGSGPSQTQINWNGLPVNSPTTGSIDLSLLSGGMADAIDIVYGAGGSLFGNGTFGGSINLTNKPEWDNRLLINIAGEAGSWNHYKTGLNLRTGNNSFQYHLSGMYQSSPNAYRYHNFFKAGNPVEYRMNDSLNLCSFQQHLFFKLPDNWYIQYGIWFNNRIKQSPASMSTTPVFTALQKDRSLRQFVRASRSGRKTSLEIVAAYFTDSLSYSEISIAHDSILKQSQFRSSDSYLSVSQKWLLNEKLTLESGADLEYQKAKTESYSDIADESRGAVFGLLKYQNHQISTDVSYRQVFYSMTGPKPLWAIAFQYHTPVSGLSLKTQVSNKFRFPTLNDRYWVPGGNPSLLPETGMGYDLGASWDMIRYEKASLNLNAMLFTQQINNWIQWVPVGTYWSPQNIRQVNCQGLELDMTGRWKAGEMGYLARAMYSYTESFDMSAETVETRSQRQLSYVPFHLLRVQAGLDYQKIEASLIYKFTGQRFTTDDHDPWLVLDPIHLIDVSFGYTFLLKKNRIILSGNVSNLLDTSYQLIRAYPAPGRSFYLTVNYLFNQKFKNDDSK